MVRFYTQPPNGVNWPYVMSNYRRVRLNPNAKSVIIDTGVEIFRRGNLDYDLPIPELIERMLEKRDRIREQGIKEVFIVIPDYPDDYPENPLNLWWAKYDNIERTINNIIYVTDNHRNDANWIVPIQGYDLQPKSILRSLWALQELGITKLYDFFALGNVCTISQLRAKGYSVNTFVSIIQDEVKIMRQELPGKKIHVFGLWVLAINQVWRDIYSFDSHAWTRPNSLAYTQYLKKQGRKRASRKNKRDSIVYFWAWVYTLIHKYNIRIEGIKRDEIRERLNEALEKEIITLDRFLLG